MIEDGIKLAQKIAVASGKGGVGKSSLSVALSLALCQRGRKVLVVDCDTMRSVDLLLGTAQSIVYDWADVILSRCELSDAVYESNGVSMISCPPSYEKISVESFKKFIGKIEGDFEYIILDCPAGTMLGFILACSAADRGLIVSLADPVSVRAANEAARQAEKLGLRNIRLIINKVSKARVLMGKMLGTDSVIDQTQVQLIGTVPEDKNIKSASMGTSVFDKKNYSYKYICDIAARLEGESRKLR